MSIQKFYRRHTIPLTLLLAIFASLLLSMLIVSQRTQAYEVAVTDQLDSQQVLLQDLAVATAQNRINSAIGVSIADCPADERASFDNLLGRLDEGLSTPELRELNQLFSACAHVQAMRKSVVVAQLKREVAALEAYATQLSAITGNDAADTYNVGSWAALVQYEETQKQGLADLVDAQKKIITTLLDGKEANSPEMLAILDEVKETQESLLFANTQAATLRAELGA